jgi:hypothetical protein
MALWFAAAPAAAATVRVNAGDDLQRALTNARPGDIIELDGGATFTGSFTLPRKDGSSDAIVVRSAVSAEPGRVSPQSAAGFAKIRAAGGPAIQTAPGAHHWRLELLDVSGSGGIELIALGDGSSAQNAPAAVPYELVVDRVYVHGDARLGVKRCIALNSASTVISNSYVSDCKVSGQDAQAIAGWNGPGPFTITNNYLEGAGENVLFGGADPSIPNLVPSDIQIRDNLISKPPAWRQERWQVKNLLELKNARRVTISGNVLENNWEAAQSGFAVLFTVRNQDGGCRWCRVEDVTFAGNTLQHVAAGIEVLGFDDEHPSEQTKNITIRDNVFRDVDPKKWGGNGYAFLLLGRPRDIVIDHNTLIQENASGVLQVDGPPILGFVFTNNVASEGAYGIIGTDRAPGNDSLRTFFPGALISRNVIAGADAGRYPADNLFPSREQFRSQFTAYDAGDYALKAASAWRGAGTDGRDLGASAAPPTPRDRQPPRDRAKPRREGER